MTALAGLSGLIKKIEGMGFKIPTDAKLMTRNLAVRIQVTFTYADTATDGVQRTIML